MDRKCIRIASCCRAFCVGPAKVEEVCGDDVAIVDASDLSASKIYLLRSCWSHAQWIIGIVINQRDFPILCFRPSISCEWFIRVVSVLIPELRLHGVVFQLALSDILFDYLTNLACIACCCEANLKSDFISCQHICGKCMGESHSDFSCVFVEERL